MITTKKSNLKKEIKKIIKRFPTAEIYQNEAIEELLNLIPKAKEEGKREAYKELKRVMDENDRLTEKLKSKQPMGKSKPFNLGWDLEMRTTKHHKTKRGD